MLHPFNSTDMQTPIAANVNAAYISSDPIHEKDESTYLMHMSTQV